MSSEVSHFNASCLSLTHPFLDEFIFTHELGNGLKVIFKEDHSAEVAAIQVWVKTGSIHEGRFLGSGISHYVEHMLFKGTEQHNYREISQLIQTYGGQMNAYTTFDRTVYYIDIPSESLEIAVDILSDIVFQSTFPEPETEKERSVILREIDMGKDDPDHELSEHTFKVNFQKHPYRYPIIGIKSLFENISHQDLLAYYRERYVPNNVTLVIVGPKNPNTMLELAEKYFGRLAMRSTIDPYIPEEPKQLAPRKDSRFGDYNVIRGALTFKTPHISHPDSPALSVLASILGQGYSGIFNQKIREEKQLVDSIDASLWNPGTSGLFWISYICNPKKQASIESVLHDLLSQISNESDSRKSISQGLIDKVVRQTIVAEINARKTMHGQASRLGYYDVVLGDLYYPQILLKNIQSITPSLICSLIPQYLKLETSSHVTLSPPFLKKPFAAPCISSPRTSPQNLEGVDSFKVLTPKITLPDFESIALTNGLKILLQPFSSIPKIHLCAAFLGGPLYEAEDYRGATSLLATLMTKDTAKRSAQAVAETIESVGGSFYEFSGNNTFGMRLEVLPMDFNLGLDLIQQALTSLHFNPKTFDVEKQTQISQIEDLSDDVFQEGIRILRKAFFGKHPYHTHSLGTIECLERLSIDNLTSLQSQLIRASNLTLAVSGQFNRNAIIDLLTSSFEKLPNYSFEKSFFPFKGPAQVGSFQELRDRQQTIVYLAFPDAGITEKDYYIGEVLDEIFSGMSSQLFIKVREEKGMAYSVGSCRISGIHCGMFCFYAGTHERHHRDVLEAIHNEVERAKSGKITDKELQAAKTKLSAQKRMSLQKLGSRAMDAALQATYGLDINTWRNYSSIINSIQLKDLTAFAQKYFRQDQALQLTMLQESRSSIQSEG